jgi:predicted esterase
MKTPHFFTCLLGFVGALALACGPVSPSAPDAGAIGGSPPSGGSALGAGGSPLGAGGLPSAGGTPASGGAIGSGGVAPAGGAAAGGEPSQAGGSGGSGASTGGSSGGSDGAGGTSGEPAGTAGCGRDSTLKNTPGSTLSYNELTVDGTSRRYVLRLPTDYDKNHPYPVILGFHGATGNANEVAGGNSPYFGLFERAAGSTIFVAMEAVGGIWSSAADVTYVDEVLNELKAELCIDSSRIGLEGFSQGGAMTYTLACARPGVFWAAVTHSPGGLAMPTGCEPIPYFSSLGQQENDKGQTMTADFFAKSNHCDAETLPKAPSGGHLCSDYQGCDDGKPVRWCPYDGGHTPSPSDAGQGKSWMPDEVWAFFTRL